jgi:tetratricopeptide (TPR) repeat protein
MSVRTRIELQTAKHLTAAQELALVKAAYARQESSALRATLASLMVQADEFEGIIALLEGRKDLSIRQEMQLATAWLRRESEEGHAASLSMIERAMAKAQSPEHRGAVLALRSKVEAKLGHSDAARSTLIEALRLDPHNKDVCKRLATIDLTAGRAADLLNVTSDLLDRGANHAWSFASHAMARAATGDIAGAHDVLNDKRFRHAEILSPPAGWDDIESFNAALAEELVSHSGLRFTRYGSAAELSWRIDAPLTRKTPLLRLLLEQIRAAVDRYIETIADIDHDWVRARPMDARLDSSCVITEAPGYEAWHLHPFAWLSGAYYVRVPDAIAFGQGDEGVIAFGLPEDIAGAEAAEAFGIETIRPQNGLMLLFPSQVFHRTYPHGLDDRRICIAFDVRPV